MKFKPKFDSQLFSNSLEERLRPAAPLRNVPPAAEFASGLRVGGELWTAVPPSEAGSEKPPDNVPEDSPQLPEPGPWLADLLQQRKEMKS